MRNNTMIKKTLIHEGDKIILEVVSAIRRVWQRKQGAPRQTFNTQDAKNYLTERGLTSYTILEESATVGNSADVAQSGRWIFEKIKAEAKPKKKASATMSRTRKSKSGANAHKDTN